MTNSLKVYLNALVYPAEFEECAQVLRLCEKSLDMPAGSIEKRQMPIHQIELVCCGWPGGKWLLDACMKQTNWRDGNVDCMVGPETLALMRDSCRAVLAFPSLAETLFPCDYMSRDELLVQIAKVADDLDRVLELFGTGVDCYRVSLGI